MQCPFRDLKGKKYFHATYLHVRIGTIQLATCLFEISVYVLVLVWSEGLCWSLNSRKHIYNVQR